MKRNRRFDLGKIERNNKEKRLEATDKDSKSAKKVKIMDVSFKNVRGNKEERVSNIDRSRLKSMGKKKKERKK